MLFKYKAVDQEGKNKEGEIDAPNRDMAISGLQRRGLVVISIKDDKESKSILSMSFFEKFPTKIWSFSLARSRPCLTRKYRRSNLLRCWRRIPKIICSVAS